MILKQKNIFFFVVFEPITLCNKISNFKIKSLFPINFYNVLSNIIIILDENDALK